MTDLTLAIDWTPNINHIGFFIAKAKGFYSDLDISVKITDPSEDNYTLTPAKKVELNKADFALCPTESILSYRTKDKPLNLIAVAAILLEDMSAIAVRSRSNIKSPRELDGKSYASFKAKYEDKIVQQMIKNDGGKGSILVVHPEKLGIWETLTRKKFDSTWIFTNWEGVEAEQNAIDLNLFKMKDYSIPYSYSPMLVAEQTFLNSNKDTCRNFLKATKKGFLFTLNNPTEAIQILSAVIPEKDKHINLQRALELSIPAFGNHTNWGLMEESVVDCFLKWIYENRLETKKIESDQIMTNKFLIY